MMYKKFKPFSNVIKLIASRALTSPTYRTRNSVKLSYHIDDVDENEILEFSASPPLLIMHGLFGAKQNWHSVSKILAKNTGKKVITVDVRNHGQSEHSDQMDYDLMKDDIIRLMDELWLDSTILVGHSMGGKIAMTTALCQPDRVHALVVVDVSPTISPGTSHLLEFAKRMKQCKLERGKPLSAVRRSVEHDLSAIVESKMVRNFLITNVVEHDGAIQWRLNLDAIIANYNNILGFPQHPTPFEKETLFIGGSLSHYISEDTKPQIMRLFPRARIEHVLSAGHWVHTENPTEFLRILIKFLEEIS